MEKTGADFTNCFRALNILTVCGLESHKKSVKDLETELISQCSSLEEIIDANESSFDSQEFQLFLVLLQTNPQLLEMLGKGPKAIERVLAKMEKTKELKTMTSEQKRNEDSEHWEKWIDNYVNRIEYDVKEFASDLQELQNHNNKRLKVMNENNPKYVLRNYLAKEAIERAEAGDFSKVNHLLKILQNPYNECCDDTNPDKKDYCKRPPLWANRLKVSCSS
ncbi:unnamed protein product [Oppiella nova]|uniref:Selenoprotein O n=1 Tax=Oppiella nova TaxID=334625 RepID=A0A7R9M2P7_9ACAR|nr:unnamed protein product [Oppiella nova]CAG2169438.1 unnamed protein product [Oppiella nova]